MDSLNAEAATNFDVSKTRLLIFLSMILRVSYLNIPDTVPVDFRY